MCNKKELEKQYGISMIVKNYAVALFCIAGTAGIGFLVWCIMQLGNAV